MSSLRQFDKCMKITSAAFFYHHIPVREAMKKHVKTVRKTRNFEFEFHQFAALFFVTVLCVALYFTRGIDRNDAKKVNVGLKGHNNVRKHSTSLCNLFHGKWVYDNVSYPLYKGRQCQLNEEFDCERNGREDLEYENWRWQPHQCELPRFNGRAFMEKIKGKRLVFVGDSLNRNQWRSMLCLIESSAQKPLTLKDNLYIFHAREYNATVEFYWSPFLVESNCDNMTSHRVDDRIIRINAIEKHAQHWNDADILIFDSFLWWFEASITLLWGSFGSPDAIYTQKVSTERKYEITLNTWSDWLELNINKTKTKLFFMSASPFHCKGEISGVPQHCYKQKEPISIAGNWGCPANDHSLKKIVESAIEKLGERGIKVQYINVTQMSGYRKDAHPSVHKKFYRPVPEEQLKDPERYSDCIHWCLPGVPDVWNEILYAYIMYPYKYQ